MALPDIAHADAWDIFTARCLAPMGRVLPPRVDDLPRGGAARAAAHFDGDAFAAMQSYIAAPDVTLVIVPEGSADFPGCVMVADGDGAWAASDAWLADALRTERWEPWDAQSGLLDTQHYDGTTWREPRLRFARLADPGGGWVIFAVTETDRES